jgi:hypothetical protein
MQLGTSARAGKARGANTFAAAAAAPDLLSDWPVRCAVSLSVVPRCKYAEQTERLDSEHRRSTAPGLKSRCRSCRSHWPRASAHDDKPEQSEQQRRRLPCCPRSVQPSSFFLRTPGVRCKGNRNRDYATAGNLPSSSLFPSDSSFSEACKPAIAESNSTRGTAVSKAPALGGRPTMDSSSLKIAGDTPLIGTCRSVALLSRRPGSKQAHLERHSLLLARKQQLLEVR